MSTQPVLHPVPDALPWDDRPAHPRRDRIGGLRLAPASVARFDALLHEIHPAAPHVDPDRIASIGRWLLALPADRARAMLDARLDRIARLHAMLDDPDWDRRPAACAHLRKLLAYVDDDLDLIPDRIPLLGLLDDVVLLELAWPAIAQEAEDYLDFCEYRRHEDPAGDGAQRREAWIRARLDALALHQQLARVGASRYAGGALPDRPFRIS